MEIFALSDIGAARSENQDRVHTTVISQDVGFVVVCDGMGGQNAGGYAAERAMDVIVSRIESGYRFNIDEDSIRSLMINSVKTANAVVYDIAAFDESKSGMGTTCVAVIKRGSRLYCVNAGDSRAYLVGKELKQITKDHTMVMQLYESGEITLEEMKNHPQRNLITKAIGADEIIYPDYFEIDIPEGEAVLLCSDGLYGRLEDEDIRQIITENEHSRVPALLIKKAIEEGSKDNITAAVLF